MHIPRNSDMSRLSVAVIGAGAGGICMGVGLRKAGVERFTIYEQSSGIGGTWWDNVYPGAEVDTPQPFYSFSFATFDFTRTHVRQAELLTYLHTVADNYSLRDNLRLNTKVKQVAWDAGSSSYVVTTQDGSSERYDVVVSAVGLLNNPRYPDWPGLDDFERVKFHSSRWDHSVDIEDKVVAVVGTGSTAAQIIPTIAPKVKQLYIYQRQPGWVVPKGERIYDSKERAALLNPIRRRVRYWQQYLDYERRRGAGVEGTAVNQAAQRRCLDYIQTVFADRPDLAKLVTPEYPFGGKRPVQDSNYFPSLLRDNVELVPHSVTRVTKNGIVDETGREREVDVLVMCTGFRAPEFLSTVDVIGPHDRSLQQAWNGSPHALLGMMVPGFPNFYMLYGPNTNGAPIMFLHERQAEFVLGNLARMAKDNIPALEVREDVTKVFNAVLDRSLQRRVVTQYKVHHYAFSSSGREVIGWPYGMTVYTALMRGLRPVACTPVK